MLRRSVRRHPAKVIVQASTIIEEMESRHPEQTIALVVLDAITAPSLGDDRYVRLGDLKDYVSAFGGTKPEPKAVCDRCRAPKGLHVVGQSCNNNCGGRVVLDA